MQTVELLSLGGCEAAALYSVQVAKTTHWRIRSRGIVLETKKAASYAQMRFSFGLLVQKLICGLFQP